MRRTLSLVSVFLLTTLVLAGNRPVRADHPPHLVGTYSTMHSQPESLDVQGVELKIVYAGTAVQGALQIAHQVPSRLFLVNIKNIQHSISFNIDGAGPYSGKFVGNWEDNQIVGEFHFNNGTTEKVTLPRAPSYWDNPNGY